MDKVGYIVLLDKRTCTCRMWQLNGIPCPHAISAISYLKHDPANYIDPMLSVEKCKVSYSYCLEPMNGQNLWPRDGCEVILPPPRRRMPGRPKKNRRKADHEEPKIVHNNGSLPRTGRQMRCTNCKQLGHNKKSCKNAYVHLTRKKVQLNLILTT